MKYKIGDTVRIRKDLKRRTRYSDIYINDVMYKFKGTLGIVTATKINGADDAYTLDNRYIWGESALEPVLSIKERLDILTELSGHMSGGEFDKIFSPRQVDYKFNRLQSNKQNLIDANLLWSVVYSAYKNNKLMDYYTWSGFTYERAEILINKLINNDKEI